MWQILIATIATICNIKNYLIKKKDKDNTLINTSTYSKLHPMELKITHFMLITCNIIGTDVNQLIQIQCKGSWLMSYVSNISMISKSCIPKTIKTDPGLKENTLIDLWNLFLKPMTTHQNIKDQLTILLKIKVCKKIIQT